ncbi:MAG: cupin domain-containing protein [Rhodocyclaceae bacterium]|nr:cupin domain-containing protein [Rhodocyclaceae bacterium]
MNILLVHCHPESRSFCAALHDAAIELLTAAGHRVAVSDLYAMGFNPVAGAADFGQRKNSDTLNVALEQRHAVDTDTLAADIRAEIDKVQAADLLIFTFPLYWMSVPALLKGWFDRVFVSGLFYGGKRVYEKGGMAGKRALVAVTTGGREHMFGAEAIHGELTGGAGSGAMLRSLLQGSLGYVGFEVLEPFVAYHVPYVDDAARQTMLADWKEALRHLGARPSLPMPRLNDFDEIFRPVTATGITCSQRDAVTPYATKDGSEIRELMHPAMHGNRKQSLAEATVPAGTRTRLHRHAVTEELYHITQGEGRMTLGEKQFAVRVGDTILIPPGSPHCIEATGTEPLRLLCCCAPAYAHDDTELL